MSVPGFSHPGQRLVLQRFLSPAGDKNRKSAFFENQELQMRSRFVDENKSIPISHPPPKFI